MTWHHRPVYEQVVYPNWTLFVCAYAAHLTLRASFLGSLCGAASANFCYHDTLCRPLAGIPTMYISNVTSIRAAHSVLDAAFTLFTP